jgi:DNA-binding transcriptional LysR family regulator
MAVDPRITFHKLEVFQLVVDLGGMTRAAERLYLAQPVVTAHIKSLERRFGAKLFYREGRTLHLTEAGRAVYAWTNEVLRRTRELSRDLEGLSDGTRGSVVVGASMSIGSYALPPLLTAFRKLRPEVSIRLNISDAERAIADTEAGEDDFAIVVMANDPSAPGLVAEPIGADEFMLVAAPDTDVPTPITPSQLSEQWFIEAQQGSIRRTFTDAALQELALSDRQVAIELGHPEAMKRAAIGGLGLCMLFRSAVSSELQAGTLREIKLEGHSFAGPVYLVHRKDKLFSAAHLELLADIRAHFALEADGRQDGPASALVPAGAAEPGTP